MAVKIIGYLELIGYDGTAGARLFYRFYVSDSAKVASTIYDTTCTRGGRKYGKYCGTRCATMQGTCSKSVGVHPSKCLSPGLLVESANRWRLIGTPDIWPMKFDSCRWINRWTSVRRYPQLENPPLYFIILRRLLHYYITACNSIRAFGNLLTRSPHEREIATPFFLLSPESNHWVLDFILSLYRVMFKFLILGQLHHRSIR